MAAKDNKEILSELENIQNLLYELQNKEYFLQEGSDIQFAEKSFNIQNDLGALEVPAVFSNFPTFPIDASYYAATQKDKEGKGKIFKIALIATAVILAIYFITNWHFLNTIGVIGIFATAVLGYFFNASRKEYNKKKEVYDKSVKKYEKTNKDFLSALEIFEEQKEACILAAKEYSKKHVDAYEKIFNEFVKKIDAQTKAEERVEEINNELSNNNIISREYYHLIDNIVSNLKSGRADDYKEALNLAIKEEKEEQERQQRLAQEEERNRILAMQAEEERRHNEQMERQQREQEEARLREEKRHNDAVIRQQREQAYEAKRQADKAASDARNQAERTRQMGVSKCASCANSRNCPSDVKNNGSGLTCGGYRPYGAK